MSKLISNVGKAAVQPELADVYPPIYTCMHTVPVELVKPGDMAYIPSGDTNVNVDVGLGTFLLQDGIG